MASSLAPEWIEVRVGKELKIFPTGSSGYVSASFLGQSSRMTLPTFFNCLDPFQAFRRVNFFICDISSAGAGGVFRFDKLFCSPRMSWDSGFWEAHGTGAAAVIGSDKAEAPRSPRHLFRHVLRARPLRDLTG